ncbi:hypothetical protein BJ998_005699 [Kutzneria kofuensis]|uniref:Uncharacterized protein n=1 Tax=Kutzneria kofuensis TaxID=103725 RepID=A0A7W9NJT5_9PSEU|nr:hypothetical protein [Kutzneria kofuensis]
MRVHSGGVVGAATLLVAEQSDPSTLRAVALVATP